MNELQIYRQGSIELITKIVCSYFNLARYQLFLNTRKRDIVYPRQVAMYLIRKHTGTPLQAIGALFNRKHDTVISACKTVENMIDNYKYEKETIQYLDKIIFKSLSGRGDKSYDMRVDYNSETVTIITRPNFSTMSLMDISKYFQQQGIPRFFKLTFI